MEEESMVDFDLAKSFFIAAKRMRIGRARDWGDNGVMNEFEIESR